MHPGRSWNGLLFAAAPTPIDSEGTISTEGLGRLVRSLARSKADGVVIGTFYGRAPRLTADQWRLLLSTWREGLGEGKILVASVGAAAELRRPAEIFEDATARASLANQIGADALVVQPPGAVRGRPERDRLVLEYHAILAEAGLPMLISYRRESSGGIAYGPEVLAQLLARSEVLGVEIATIDGITTFQQVESLTREIAPDKLVISGEDRFLGYSLIAGANAAMVGIGTVYPSIVKDLLEAHAQGDASRLIQRTKEVDALARPIFKAPFDQTTRRILEQIDRSFHRSD